MRTCLQDPQAYRRIVIADEFYQHLTIDRRRRGPAATPPGRAGHTVTTGRVGKMFGVTGRKVQIFPFPSRFGAITKTQHFVMRPLTWYNSCLR